MDILFVVDSSGSVQRVYEEQKTYLNEILSEIEPGEQRHRVALVQFSGSNHQKTEWSYDAFDDNSALMHAFQSVRHFTGISKSNIKNQTQLCSGTTYIGAALQSARAVLDTRRRNVPSIVVLLSDGFSQDDATEQAKVIRNLPNVEFIALSVSEFSNSQYLSELTDDPSRVYIGEKKETLRQKLVNKLRCK
ncbi:hypothetical protein L596_004158 [Steinernema carpocapsae]|uniref:VWFA domain-containing protein n=1 Tax=Steinernema carpocapsae TaxID=34508 RepID=A0A4U8UWH5_STECR|nr:hypothetical protein L596_004158 [Steinernema carpocapsae]